MHQINNESSWIDPIIQYLTNGALLGDSLETKRLRWMASQYMLMNEQLYKRLFSLLLLKYLRPTEDDYALQEVH